MTEKEQELLSRLNRSVERLREYYEVKAPKIVKALELNIISEIHKELSELLA